MALGKEVLRSEKGFSLIELMIVVGIIGLLATLAVPRFQQFQAKARMAEAKNLLNHIYTLEEAYHLDNSVYMAMAAFGKTGAATWNCTPALRPNNAGAVALGLEINPCSGSVPRFAYSVGGVTQQNFIISATSGAGAANSVCPGKTAVDFSMDQTRTMDSPGGAAAAPMTACPAN